MKEMVLRDVLHISISSLLSFLQWSLALQAESVTNILVIIPSLFYFSTYVYGSYLILQLGTFHKI